MRDLKGDLLKEPSVELEHVKFFSISYDRFNVCLLRYTGKRSSGPHAQMTSRNQAVSFRGSKFEGHSV